MKMNHVVVVLFWIDINMFKATHSVQKIQIHNRVLKSTNTVRPRSGKNNTSERGPQLRGSTKQRKQGGIAKNILLQLSQAGANITKCPGEALYLVENMRFGDTTWKIFEEFAECAPDSPSIFVAFSPPPYIWNTSAIPPLDQAYEIVVEAKSIRSRYAKLDLSAFAGGTVPNISGPDSSTLSMLEEFQSPKLALSKLFERIQNPNLPEYPVLAALPSGSYICSVVHHWRNAALVFAVFKP